MIWIIGNKGMLGKELSHLFDAHDFSYVGTDIEIDIADITTLQNFTAEKNINWIINCAAYTAVDKAEDERDLCYKINVTGSENIAKTAKKLNAKLIYISTDYVFDGNQNSAYTEKDEVNPLSFYGKTKLEGEIKTLESNKESIILRTAWLYGQHGKNFVSTMLNLMKIKNEIGVVSDQWGAPTWTKDLAEAIFTIIKKDMPLYDIYNASGEGKTTWYDFAKEIQEIAYQKKILTNKIKINSLKTKEYPVKAKRPQYSLLDKTKLKNTFGFVFPDWKESLNKFFNDLKYSSV
jgi:dTDP-4-dehydrorhamnose reductase